MTRIAFDLELRELNERIIKMGYLAEEQIRNSMEALMKQDENLADEIIKKDDVIDKIQDEIEEKCVKLIARQQPIATDLRIIFTAIKIISDIERIADYGVDICKITKRLKNEKYIKELSFLPKMSKILSDMVIKAMNSLRDRNVKLAYEVCSMDDEIDLIYRMLYVELMPLMIKNPNDINQITQFLFAAKFIERGADHVTNIGESLIYLVTGEQRPLNE